MHDDVVIIACLHNEENFSDTAVEGGGLKKIPLFDQHTNTRLIGQCVLHSLTAMSGEALMQTAKRMG